MDYKLGRYPGETKSLSLSFEIEILTTQKKLKYHVFPIIFYNMDVWTTSDKVRKSVTSFETWRDRRILHISWIYDVTNEKVLHQVNTTLGYNLENWNILAISCTLQSMHFCKLS